MRSGLPAPLCGTHYNEYKDSCGAYIRSEIWAAIAPGAPDIATKYAYEDAILDHGNGEGTYAEIFFAALESAAFVEGDFNQLIQIGLTYIPQDCACAQAARFVMECYSQKMDYKEVRDQVLLRYRGCVSGANPETGSREDYEKGFFDGRLGFDVPSNLAIIIIGMLYSEGDFEKLMQITINCGEDTDCTAATVGAIYGIIHGEEGIPKKWLDPIGTSIKTGCLNLGELGGYGSEIPQDIDELVVRLINIGKHVGLAYTTGLEITDEIPVKKNIPRSLLCENPEIFGERARGPVYSFDFFDIQVIYEGGPTIRNAEIKKVTLRIVNKYKHVEALDIKVWCDDTMNVQPSKSGRILIKSPYFRGPAFRGNMECAEFEFLCESVDQPTVGGVFQITSPGRHTNMTIPFLFVNGNLQTYEEDFYYEFK